MVAITVNIILGIYKASVFGQYVCKDVVNKISCARGNTVARKWF